MERTISRESLRAAQDAAILCLNDAADARMFARMRFTEAKAEGDLRQFLRWAVATIRLLDARIHDAQRELTAEVNDLIAEANARQPAP